MPFLHERGAEGASIIATMTGFWARLGCLGVLVAVPAGCSGEDEPAALSQLSVVEVTTVTTVQGSSGIFLSPRPQLLRPDYVESGASASAPSGEPSVEDDRAKVDTALLFRASKAQRFSFEATLPDVEAQHFYPALSGRTWPIELLGDHSDASSDDWTEFAGWRAYGGLTIDDAAAATFDYERLGLRSPLVVSMEEPSSADIPVENQTLLVTNRSLQPVARALLIYSHAGGIGVREVGNVAPGRAEMTATGPKEGPATELLDKARGELTDFFAEELGPELAAAVARAKSIPFLETHGLRLIYLLNDADAPAGVGLPTGVGAQRRVCIGQAEVFPQVEEAQVLELLDADDVSASDVAAELGRFARAKLEVATLNGSVDAESVLVDLAE